jgi:ankyrin repeat protein
VAESQQAAPPPKSPSSSVQIVPNRIEFIPPLVKAVLARDPQQVRVELATQDINLRLHAKEGRAGFTPLILAASLSDPQTTQILVEKGAKANVFDDFNRSAFWYAALNGNVEVIQALLGAAGAREAVNAADFELKRTPLHLAVHGNEPEIVNLLLKIGASPREQRDLLGETPEDYCKRRDRETCLPLR